jgi:hypothetical protein
MELGTTDNNVRVVKTTDIAAIKELKQEFNYSFMHFASV